MSKNTISRLKSDKMSEKLKNEKSVFFTQTFFFEKSDQFLSDCYEEITFFGNFHRQNKNIKTRFR